MKNNTGYNPTLFLGDFTGNEGDDILVVIETGGSGVPFMRMFFPTLTVNS